MLESDTDRRGPPPCSTCGRWKVGGLAILGFTTLIVLFAHDPANSMFYPPCPFRALTGFYCPGCGTLRALHQLLHGHLVAAFWLNPLAALLLPFLGYASLCSIVLAGTSRPLPGSTLLHRDA